MYTEQIHTSVPNSHIRIGYVELLDAETLANMHIHNEIEIIAVTKGSMLCSDGVSEYKLSRGEVIFINSRTPHRTYCCSDLNYILLQFNIEDFTFSEQSEHSKYLSKFINSMGERIAVLKSPEMYEYTVRCNSEYTDKKPAYEAYIKACIYGILGFLYRNNIILDAERFFDLKTADVLMPVFSYIESNYASPITLEDLSAVANLNKYYFCRLFKKATHSTVTDFVNFVRIYKAEKMLTSSNRSISDISYDVGFSSVSYFNRTFRKFAQLTPTQYRRVKYSPKT